MCPGGSALGLLASGIARATALGFTHKQWYTYSVEALVGKRNVTLTIDDDLLVEARIVAARRHTSVSDLVREHLRRLVEQDRLRHAAWQSVRHLVERPAARAGGPLPAREDLHARRA